MARRTPFFRQRTTWIAAVGVGTLAFWVVGLGVGWRAWILAPKSAGLAAHAQAFGADASVYWIPATVLTLTTAVMAIGLAIVRHLVDGTVEMQPETPTLPTLETLEPLEPLEPFTDQVDVSGDEDAEDPRSTADDV